MKVLLLFPPSWHPSQPYLSLPSLTAFLRKHGVCDVVQRDLNIELLDVLLTRKKCAELFQRITDKLKRLEGSPPVDPIGEERRNALAYAAQAIPSVMDKVEYAKDTLRSKDFYDLAKYMEGVHVVNEYLGMISTLYYPSVMTALHNDMRYSVYSSVEILRALDDEEENIFRDLYKSHALSSILAYSPQLVGISITSTSQIIPGLTIARLIKAEKKDVHITVGGSVFTKLIDNLRQGSDLFSVVDSFIVFEGERALLELVKQVDGKKEFKKVPNLVYLEDGVVKANEPFCTEDLNALPTPDFDGLPLRLYHAPASVLPIQTSRGYSCLPSLFGMEKDSPLTHNPAEYGISSIMAPKSEDLGLGYFYDVERGMSVQEAEQMYHHVIGKLSDELCPFPYNYSMPDGLLYIVDSKKTGLCSSNL
ncbi:MAG TPA: hypothetical protein VJ440_09910 [Candidatus Brocadiaceae bacterium]|nr:hypothetical protein [Candidatus Brocadiaceae bacterium]